jgi:hypothetical protein
LSEVLASLGTARLQSLLPDVLAHAASPLAHVREGSLVLCVYLPQNFKDELTPFLPIMVPPILKGTGKTACAR